MRYLDINGNEMDIESVDYNLGHFEDETIVVTEHEAVDAVEEQGHWETIAEYPNGGKDVKWIVDVEGVEAQDAWTETEEIKRWIPYTEEELAQIAEQKAKEEAELAEAQANSVEAQLAELQLAFLEFVTEYYESLEG